MSPAQHTPVAAEHAREALEAYGRMMYDAGMDAASDFRDRHREGEAKEKEAAEMLDAFLASQSTPPPEPSFYTVFALYEGGGETGWIALPGYSNETVHGVKNLVLESARKEGYRGTVAGRLLELGWEIRPVFDAPPATTGTPPPESAGQGLSDAEIILADLISLEADGLHASEGAIEVWESARAILAANPTAKPDGGSKA